MVYWKVTPTAWHGTAESGDKSGDVGWGLGVAVLRVWRHIVSETIPIGCAECSWMRTWECCVM